MSRRLTILLVLSLAVAALVAFAWRARQAVPPASPAVAEVNGTPITQEQLEIRVASLLPRAAYHGNVPPEKLTSLRRTALDELILEELVWQDASGHGRRAEEAAVEAELARVRGRFGSETAFQAALQADGTTLAEYREFLARRVLVRQEREQRSALLEPSDAEVASYYEANTAQFVRPEQVHVLEILVKVDPSGTEEDERNARARADAALSRVRAGEPFETVAREVSEDDFRVKGGDLGWVHRGRLDRDLERSAFAAPVGRAELARSIFGFHVYLVAEREAARQLTIEEARPLIVDRVQRARRDATRREWEDGLRASAEVEILDPVLRDATPAELPALERSPATRSREMVAPNPLT